MRVLTVLPDVPLPGDTGLHLRMLGNLELVRRLGHESHVLFFSTEERPGSLALLDEVELLVDGQRHAGRRRPQSEFSLRESLRSKAGFLGSALLGRPGRTYPFAMRYDAVAGLRTVLEEATALRADVVVIPSVFLHWAGELAAAGFTVIADAADILTDVTRRIVSSYGGRNPAVRLSLVANAKAAQTQERLFLPCCDEVWVTSAPEARRVRQLAPTTRAVVVPNTVPDPGPVPWVRGLPPVVGFLGTCSYLPNLEAAERLVVDVFPRVLSAVPGAALRIAGSGLPAELAARWTALPGVEILGRVASSVDFFAGCDVVALPVTVRGGVPLKLVEALALGRPVVAFPELVAGLPLLEGRDLMVARDPSTFARCVTELLCDPVGSRRLGRAGRAAYEAHFSRAALDRDARVHSLLAPQEAA